MASNEIIKGTRLTFKIKTALSSPYQISYMNYGDSNPSHQIFCCHGLTRNSMDFDPLSKYLCTNYKQKQRITCIDLCGRGHSDSVTNHSLYKIGHHLTECDDVINHLRSSHAQRNKMKTSWIGTSYGGLLGMYYAALYYPTIDHLILNDIAPFVSREYISTLRDFCHNNPATKNIEEMQRILKEKYSAEYGPKVTDADWKRMAVDGTYYDDATDEYRLCYDPHVVEGFLMDTGVNDDGTYNDLDIFDEVWSKIPQSVKILLIRGQNSNVITREIVDKMIETHSNLSVVEIEDVGHNPILCDQEEMDIIAQFIGLDSATK